MKKTFLWAGTLFLFPAVSFVAPFVLGTTESPGPLWRDWGVLVTGFLSGWGTCYCGQALTYLYQKEQRDGS